MTRQGSSRGRRSRRLEALFAPRTIAVVGASDDPAKWGHILARRALESGTPRPVGLVNRRGGQVLGRPAYTSVSAASAALGLPVDLVVVCVPATALVETVRDAVAAGARAIVAISAGLAELGAAGAALETEAAAIATAADAVLVGPNCLGVADTGTGLQLAHALLPVGAVTVLSQSGNLVLDLAGLLAERGLGVARFVSLGNQAQLGVVELLHACLEHDGTRAVAVYAEDVVDGRGFVEAARALVEAGKPVVLLSPGRSAAAVRGAASHTGSLTSPGQVVDAACAAAGVRRVEHPTQMADLLQGLLAPRRMSGRRVAVLTDGGGHGAMAADALGAAGLETPVLGEPTGDRLRSVLWSGSSVANPVDLAGAGDLDPMNYARALQVLLEADDVDGVLLTGYFGGYSSEPGRLHDAEIVAARAMVAAIGAGSTPVAVQTIFPQGPSARALRDAGVPVHRDVDRCCDVLAGLVARSLEDPPPSYAEAAPLTDDSYLAARALVAGAGLSFPVARTVLAREQLAEAVAATGFPVVLKALGSLHKSDEGGVVLGLVDAPSTLTAYDDLVGRLRPPAVSVEAMADLAGGVELIAGCVRDRTFGPVLMVGLGGVYAETLADTAYALAPVGPAQARRLLLSLRGAALLQGARGRPPVDLAALAEAVSAFSLLAAQHPELAELEVNPLLATPSGTVALDARVVLA